MFSDLGIVDHNWIQRKFPSFSHFLYFQMLAGLDHSWSRGELVLWPLSRLILLPLIVMCAAPHHAPIFPGEMLPIFLTAILGLSNGLCGSLPIILAPAMVRDGERELAGNLMTFSYCFGLSESISLKKIFK